MITLTQYFIGRPHTPEQGENAKYLLGQVNLLLHHFRQAGYETPINKLTGSLISGLTEGGFRLPNCAQGSATSSHKEGKGVDIYDPENKLDDWITHKTLIKFGLYREAKQFTSGWCHLTTRPPKSGCRSFIP